MTKLRVHDADTGEEMLTDQELKEHHIVSDRHLDFFIQSGLLEEPQIIRVWRACQRSSFLNIEESSYQNANGGSIE